MAIKGFAISLPSFSTDGAGGVQHGVQQVAAVDAYDLHGAAQLVRQTRHGIVVQKHRFAVAQHMQRQQHPPQGCLLYTSYLPPDDGDEEDSDVVQVAIIGKPNVGKSSLTNKILGEQRVIVSNVAGTTRDAIDSYFENSYGKYNFIDTAGMRKKSKVDDSIEKYSVLRATMAIERSDVCLILIDAQEGVTEQDTKVAGLAHDAGKACIIVVNKWDLIEKDGKTMDRMREDIRRDLSYMPYAPILFISALTGQRVNRLFELINYVNDQAAVRITTGMLNSVLADAQTLSLIHI